MASSATSSSVENAMAPTLRSAHHSPVCARSRKRSPTRSALSASTRGAYVSARSSCKIASARAEKRIPRGYHAYLAENSRPTGRRLTIGPMSGLPIRNLHGAPRKPMAPARRVSLYEREIRVHLGTAAIEVLFSAGEVLSEGQRHGSRYFGSTMIGIDLARIRAAVREDCDAADARRVAKLLETDPR